MVTAPQHLDALLLDHWLQANPEHRWNLAEQRKQERPARNWPLRASPSVPRAGECSWPNAHELGGIGLDVAQVDRPRCPQRLEHLGGSQDQGYSECDGAASGTGRQSHG